MITLILIIIFANIFLFTLTCLLIRFVMKKEENEEIMKQKNIEASVSNNVYEKIEEENKKQKIRNYVEEMTLFELQQMLPDDIFTKLPKTRAAMVNEVIRLIDEGQIEFKNNNSSYYVNSDKIAENDKDYYNKDFKEKEDDIKHFKSIRKDTGISINMDIFNNIQIPNENIIETKEETSIDLEEKIKYALTLEPTRKNLNTFNALLNEYKNLDFDSKSKISRKYTSELEALKNKAEHT